MTATEIFKLFLKHELEPNERLAFMTEIRWNIHSKTGTLCSKRHYNDPTLSPQELENVFVERLIRNTWGTLSNRLGRYGHWTYCMSLSSFMKYLLYYVPSIIGNAKNKNKYLARIDVEIPKERGYKRYWQSRLIKKWHAFLQENVRNYDKNIYLIGDMNYKLLREL